MKNNHFLAELVVALVVVPYGLRRLGLSRWLSPPIKEIHSEGRSDSCMYFHRSSAICITTLWRAAAAAEPSCDRVGIKKYQTENSEKSESALAQCWWFRQLLLVHAAHSSKKRSNVVTCFLWVWINPNRARGAKKQQSSQVVSAGLTIFLEGWRGKKVSQWSFSSKQQQHLAWTCYVLQFSNMSEHWLNNNKKQVPLGKTWRIIWRGKEAFPFARSQR